MAKKNKINGDEKIPTSNVEKAASENIHKNNGSSSYISIIVMVVCIVASAISLIIYAVLPKNDVEHFTSNRNNSGTVIGTLIDGKEYLIYLRSVEIQGQKANGSSWDTGNNAPDVFYRVVWKNNQIYESDTMEDSLIAEWIPIGLSLKDSILKGQVSVDQAVKIPRVKFDSTLPDSDTVVFKVIDEDLLSGNDPIQDISLSLSKLHVGDNIFNYSREIGAEKNDEENNDSDSDINLIKAVVRVIDNSLSTDEIIQALMRGQ